MSYPPVVYDGPGESTSLALRRTDSAVDLTYPSGNTVDYLATGASTNGRFGLYRWNMGPERSGPGPHFHRTMTESFYVLDGMVELFDGSAWRSGGPGDFLHVPEGGIHGFRNESGEPASMLILFSPGAPREDYFETLAAIAGGLSLTEAELADFYERHDNHWVNT